MVTPLGPRGQAGVSKPMASPSLAILEVELQLRKNAAGANRYSESNAGIWEI